MEKGAAQWIFRCQGAPRQSHSEPNRSAHNIHVPDGPHYGSMRAKIKLFILAAIACLILILVCSFPRQRLEVHGRFSERDIAQLARLGRTENRRDIKREWAQSPWDIPQVTWVVRRFIFERVVRIERTPDDKAIVTTGTRRSAPRYRDNRYLFLSTETGWKLAPTEFE